MGLIKSKYLDLSFFPENDSEILPGLAVLGHFQSDYADYEVAISLGKVKNVFVPVFVVSQKREKKR
jgi:hypothetical protein